MIEPRSCAVLRLRAQIYQVLLAIFVSIPCVPHTYANLFPELEAHLAKP
jgi:hypothetical protein